ncbi:hypothetical protein DICPUDRAFT_151056 [Dictyostelium purpureum]|uniref:Uncharacterized protein n=1 Tax=Dictyostelium purpureum TaxID=5786 RepID=F0ZHW3_DICPU|nr:uncharacterized protein DICPUDRAFT_151056 [Dictyostelium purpureum]EGC36494.1 hypothetical protein DICPUDRAFT_151056 [Dictyostelium purpureum]|eukprot:XP_003287007.1 hypothetical protein DICPUDRAFT_151056 [Dictyostelium purpureum]
MIHLGLYEMIKDKLKSNHIVYVSGNTLDLLCARGCNDKELYRSLWSKKREYLLIKDPFQIAIVNDSVFFFKMFIELYGLYNDSGDDYQLSNLVSINGFYTKANLMQMALSHGAIQVADFIRVNYKLSNDCEEYNEKMLIFSAVSSPHKDLALDFIEKKLNLPIDSLAKRTKSPNILEKDNLPKLVDIIGINSLDYKISLLMNQFYDRGSRALAAHYFDIKFDSRYFTNPKILEYILLMRGVISNNYDFEKLQAFLLGNPDYPVKQLIDTFPLAVFKEDYYLWRVGLEDYEKIKTFSSSASLQDLYSYAFLNFDIDALQMFIKYHTKLGGPFYLSDSLLKIDDSSLLKIKTIEEIFRFFSLCQDNNFPIHWREVFRWLARLYPLEVLEALFFKFQNIELEFNKVVGRYFYFLIEDFSAINSEAMIFDERKVNFLYNTFINTPTLSDENKKQLSECVDGDIIKRFKMVHTLIKLDQDKKELFFLLGDMMFGILSNDLAIEEKITIYEYTDQVQIDNYFNKRIIEVFEINLLKMNVLHMLLPSNIISSIQSNDAQGFFTIIKSIAKKNNLQIDNESLLKTKEDYIKYLISNSLFHHIPGVSMGLILIGISSEDEHITIELVDMILRVYPDGENKKELISSLMKMSLEKHLYKLFNYLFKNGYLNIKDDGLTTCEVMQQRIWETEYSKLYEEPLEKEFTVTYMNYIKLQDFKVYFQDSQDFRSYYMDLAICCNRVDIFDYLLQNCSDTIPSNKLLKEAFIKGNIPIIEYLFKEKKEFFTNRAIDPNELNELALTNGHISVHKIIKSQFPDFNFKPIKNPVLTSIVKNDFCFTLEFLFNTNQLPNLEQFLKIKNILNHVSEKMKFMILNYNKIQKEVKTNDDSVENEKVLKKFKYN